MTESTELSLLRAEVAALRSELRAMADTLADRLALTLDGWEKRTRKNIRGAGERLAAQETAALVRGSMASAEQLPDRAAAMAYALSLASRGRMALEFGVYEGASLSEIAKERGDGQVYGFDSFEGLPETWRSGFPEGRFAVDRLPHIDGAALVTGWFDRSLPEFLARHPGPVDFVHIDCCLYSATATVLILLEPRIVPGTVLLFDEFFNYPGWQDHEYRAWSEFADRTGIGFRYSGYAVGHEQVVVEIVERPSSC